MKNLAYISNKDFFHDHYMDSLRNKGWLLLTNNNLDSFSQLLNQLCQKLTFDPARDYVSRSTQKVDAGTDAVGLHIENGHTPLPPDIVAFFSQRSASKGSQTTVCDGAELLSLLPPSIEKHIDQPINVTRTLPELYWKRYIADILQIDDIHKVNQSHIDSMLSRLPNNQKATLNLDGSLTYTLTINPIIKDNLANKPAFANALLGPSYNYQKPVYTFQSGKPVPDALLEDIAGIAETCTHDIQWRDGHVAIIDNKRVLHGRRKILVPLEERELIIGMGFL